ncbi:cupin domain-containing protein [Clostridium botulinum]|uniref:Cupin domain-containing protein n=1 Tax=Clostridium botulinum TaxID=1491 RepID=A0ABD7CK61_CLOBO|nr:cupin domain-containing protein [Clostridium botulinum]KGO14511.1 cupin [Clostridium botulinum]KIN82931.1 cupin [Clostridium botulinum]MCC5428313.1 cupin domain-containing protein [Clostridium botulinum]QRI53805.1 cupin domain-containing protein [Clostridium botulinum]
MYNTYMMYTCPYYANIPMYNSYDMYSPYDTYSWPCFVDTSSYNDSDFSMQCNNRYIPFTDELEYGSRFASPQLVKSNGAIELKDYGPQPFVVDIDEATKQNNTFRTALWTGTHLQVTLMIINVGDNIGLEMHSNVDQFIRVEEGQGLVKMGSNKEMLNFQAEVYDDFAIMIPAGTWHNIINTGNKPLKVYSIYAPPQHPRGTVHVTKADAEAAEESHH